MSNVIQGKWVCRGSSLVIGRIGRPLKRMPSITDIYRTLFHERAIFALINIENSKGNSYRCVFDDPGFDVESIKSSNARKNLRRGLTRNDVRYIDVYCLLENGFNVYKSAVTRFKDYTPMNEDEFRNKILSDSQRDGFRAYGSFVGENLVAFMTVIDVDEIVFGDVAYFNPEYSNRYPMWGLYFTVARDCVVKRGFLEFDRGAKPLVHETNIDEFLLNIGFKKKRCSTIVKGIFPFTVAVLFMDLLFRKTMQKKHRVFKKKLSALANLIREK